MPRKNFLVWLWISATFIGCGLFDSPQTRQRKALEELKQRSIPFTTEGFSDFVKKRDRKTVRLFLQGGMDPNSADRKGVPVLLWAARNCGDDMVEVLLEAGADPGTAQPDGWTPLMWASKRGLVRTVQKLLQQGADPNARSGLENTALMEAAYHGHAEIVRTLLARGADVNARDFEGWTALLWAESNDHEEIVRILKKAGATEYPPPINIETTPAEE